MATNFGWRSIFIISIILTILAMILMKHTPETKAEPIGNKPLEPKKFDVIGLIILVICMLSINVIITQTSNYGLMSPLILGLIAVSLSHSSYSLCMRIESNILLLTLIYLK